MILRRTLTFLAALLVALGAASCASVPGTSAADAAEAKAVLDRASKAMETIESLRFSLAMTGEASGQQFSLKLDGGGYVKGKRAGDMVLDGTMTAPGMPAMNLGMISRAGAFYMNMGTGWQVVPGGFGAAQVQGTQLENALAGFDLAQYVKDVEVERHTTFLGERVTKIAGKLDTQRMLGGMMDQLGGQLSGLGGISTDDVLSGIGDVHATLYVSEETDLLRAAHVSLAMEVQGEKASFDLDFTLLDVNEPVKIPKPPAAGA